MNYRTFHDEEGKEAHDIEGGNQARPQTPQNNVQANNQVRPALVMGILNRLQGQNDQEDPISA